MTALPTHPQARLDCLEAQLAARLAAGLSDRAGTVPHDISERLRVAREQALVRARQRRLAHASATAAAGPVVLGSGQGSTSLGRGGLWLNLAAWAPLLALVAGLLLIEHWGRQEQVQAAAEIDAMLLSDDLPPAAWTDPGFREYLKTAPP